MKFEKILAGAISAVMLVSAGAVMAEENNENDIMLISVSQEENTYDRINKVGTVAEIGEEQIVMVNGDEKFAVNIDKNTIIIDENGNEISVNDIKENDVLGAWCDIAQTRSIPPQSYAYALGKASEDAAPIFTEVAEISKDSSDNTVLVSSDGQYEIVLAADAENLDMIEKGNKIAVYSNMMTMSIPAQIPTEKVIILNEKNEDVNVEEDNNTDETITNFNKVIVNGTEVDAEIIDNMLPLRSVVETLGLEIDWNDEKKAITIGTMQMGVNFRIGENSYAKSKMIPFVLSGAPKLINEKTYVPIDFFTDVLEAEMTVVDGIVNINR